MQKKARGGDRERVCVVVRGGRERERKREERKKARERERARER